MWLLHIPTLRYQCWNNIFCSREPDHVFHYSHSVSVNFLSDVCPTSVSFSASHLSSRILFCLFPCCCYWISNAFLCLHLKFWLPFTFQPNNNSSKIDNNTSFMFTALPWISPHLIFFSYHLLTFVCRYLHQTMSSLFSYSVSVCVCVCVCVCV